MIPKIELKHRLRLAREAAGFEKQEQFAPQVGYSRQTISNYESGGAMPRKAVMAWASATGVPVWWLLGETEPEPAMMGRLPQLDSNQQPAGYRPGVVIDLQSKRRQARAVEWRDIHGKGAA